MVGDSFTGEVTIKQRPKRRVVHGSSGGSTFQNKEAVSIQAWLAGWVEYLRKSREASVDGGRKNLACCEMKLLFSFFWIL